MAIASIAFGIVRSNLTRSNAMAIMSNTIAGEFITTSGSNQVSTGSAADPGDGYLPVVRIAATGNIKFSIGSAPNATSDASAILLPSGAIDVFVVPVGSKVAVVDA